VPWDSDEKTHVVSPPKKIAVFIEGKRIPADPYVSGMISDLSAHHELVIYTLDGNLEEAGEYRVEKFSSRAVNSHDLVIVIVESFVWRPMGAPHVAIIWKELDFEIDFAGYLVFKIPDVPGKYPVLPPVEKLVEQATAQKVKLEARRKQRRPARVLPKDSGIVTPMPRGSIVDTMQVQIVNITKAPWKKGTHFIGCFWADNRGRVESRDPRTKMDMPKEIGAGETLICSVAIPRSPDHTENGFLRLCIDILDQKASRWLNVGCQIPMRICNFRVVK